MQSVILTFNLKKNKNYQTSAYLKLEVYQTNQERSFKKHVM